MHRLEISRRDVLRSGVGLAGLSLPTLLQLRAHGASTPFSPPSGPAQRLLQGPPSKSKFLAAGNATLLSERRVVCTGRHIFLAVRIFCSYGWGLRKNDAGWAGSSLTTLSLASELRTPSYGMVLHEAR